MIRSNDGLVEVAERDVVAVQERESEVVVLHVEALAHALRELVNEAEHALVRARRDVARARRRQLEPEPRPAATQPLRRGDAVALDGQLEPLVAGVKLEVDRVAQRVAVDRDDPVAARQTRPRGRRAGRDRGNGHARRLSGTGRFQETPLAATAGEALRNRMPWTMY